tara:strand:+ start:3699 stop:3884 length:186 start_codon:yes stop_codon:yes gene_type:complete
MEEQEVVKWPLSDKEKRRMEILNQIILLRKEYKGLQEHDNNSMFKGERINETIKYSQTQDR